MQKWDVVRVYCDFLPNPHDKFCICICPENYWFMFVNSEPPVFPKSRNLAVSIENFEAHFLRHTSYVDTTTLVPISQALVEGALRDPDRLHGALAPGLRKRIVDAVLNHDVMEPAMWAKVTE